MKYAKHALPPMTAIAAVLAFATPAMAQEVTAPVVTTPDATLPATPAPEPAPVTAVDPLSPDVTSEESSTAAPAATAPTAVRDTRAAPTARSVTRPRRATSNASITTTAAAAPVAVPAPVEPIPAAPLAAIPAPGAAVAVAAPAPLAQPDAAETAANDFLPIAGAVGLGLLALLGAGAALRRRKRRAEAAEFADVHEALYERPMAPAAFAEPTRESIVKRGPSIPAAAASAMTSKTVEAPTTDIPEDFDLSRFGPHVQAAYRGPTEDNPSLSLKHRLRRGGAMDQVARADDAIAEPAAQAAPAPIAPTDSGVVMSKLRPAAAANGGFLLGGGAIRPNPRPVTKH